MKNKKGQLALLFSIPGLIMMLIVIAASILFVVKVIEYKFIILGSTLLIMSSFYGIKHGFDKASGKIVLAFGGVGLIILMLASTGVLQAQTDFSADEIYLPNYISIHCEISGQQLQGSILVDDKTSSTCGYENDGPNQISADTFDGCDYLGKDGVVFYKVVDANTECKWGIFETGTSLKAGTSTKVSFGKKICFNENNYGQANVEYSATKYGLRIDNANGKVIFTKNCKLASNLNSIDNDIDYIPGISSAPIDLRPGLKVEHWINGYSAVVKSNDVVMFNGNQIYIDRVGHYMPIVTSKDGIKYANSLDRKSDSKLICVPSQNPLCIDGIKLEEKIENIKCSLTNQPEGYVTQGDGTECEYTCSGSKLVKGDCRAVSVCSGATPVRNPITNKCESASSLIIHQNDKACGFAQHPVTKNDVVKSWYNYIGIGDPEIIPYDDCIADSWVVYVIFGSFITIFLLGSMIIFKKESTKTKKKKN